MAGSLRVATARKPSRHARIARGWRSPGQRAGGRGLAVRGDEAERDAGAVLGEEGRGARGDGAGHEREVAGEGLVDREGVAGRGRGGGAEDAGGAGAVGRDGGEVARAAPGERGAGGLRALLDELDALARGPRRTPNSRR